MVNLQQELEEARAFARQYCDGLLTLLDGSEEELIRSYTHAGKPYGESTEDAFRWHSERYTAWKMQKAARTKPFEIIERGIEGLLALGEARKIALDEHKQTIVLTPLGLLRLHVLQCMSVLDLLDSEQREMTADERAGLLYSMATSYVMLRVA